MKLDLIIQYGTSQGGPGVVLYYLVALIVLIAFVYWTFKDARKNSAQSPYIWAAIVLFAPFVGFILYLLIGRR